MLTPRLLEARPTKSYCLFLRFADGREGEVDLEEELWGAMFEPLRDLRLFKAVRVDAELHTIVWPNGADLAPEFLYEAVGKFQVATKKTVASRRAHVPATKGKGRAAQRG